MAFAADLKVLFHLALAPIRGDTHSKRLESFYAGQAKAYDDSRAGMLSGRRELYQSIEPPYSGVWIDMGGATGWNLDSIGHRIERLRTIYVVDLAPSLLAIAEKRIAERGWHNVKLIEADATTFTPQEGSADIVTFSYSLTMIPDWYSALDNALRILKPGGTIGVVDFYVSRKHPAKGQSKHRFATRAFWPAWFGNDNVFPSPDHLPYLQSHFQQVDLVEAYSKIKYLPIVRVPYFRFIGKKL